jgi:hypothetical protein
MEATMLAQLLAQLLHTVGGLVSLVGGLIG